MKVVLVTSITCVCFLTLVSPFPLTADGKKRQLCDDDEGDVHVPVSMDEWTPDSPVNPEELGDFFEGDIELPLPILGRNGLRDERYRWPEGVVPYVIGKEFSAAHKKMILRAMNKIFTESDQCITFKEQTDEQDYIHFQQDLRKGCQSTVGRRGGKQIVNYHPLCLKKVGTVMHEMLHFLGFYHEHSRYDRDDFIDIIWGNIDAARHHNFKPYSSSTVTGFGEGYDYNSIMHYSQYAFSASGRKTIVPKDPNAKIGQRERLSKIDLLKLKKMYKCPT